MRIFFPISEDELKIILERRGSHYISCQGKFREEIVKRVKSRSPILYEGIE